MPIQEVKDAVADAIAETGFVDPQKGYAQQPGPDAGADDDSGGGDGVTPSAAALAEIDRNPRSKAVYRSLVQGFHGANADLDARKRFAAEAQQVVRVIREDPHTAIRAMARVAGVQLADEQPQQTLLERTRERLRRAAGDEVADVLAPVLNEVVAEIAGEAVAPVTGVIHQAQAAAATKALSAGVNEFAQRVVADGGEWGEEIEQEMADLVPRVLPGRGINLPEYLEVLHSRVMGLRRRAAKGRRRAGVEEDEPVRIRAGMDPKAAVTAAVAAARRQVGRR